MRRIRQTDWVRRMVAETRLSVDDLIWPIFIGDGENKREPVIAMPGVDRLSIDLAVEAAKKALDLGIPCMALFPNTQPNKRTSNGNEACNPENLVCSATQAIKSAGRI